VAEMSAKVAAVLRVQCEGGCVASTETETAPLHNRCSHEDEELAVNSEMRESCQMPHHEN
jgi:hypothetical protein